MVDAVYNIILLFILVYLSHTEEFGAEGPWKEKVKEYFEKELSQPSTLKKVT